MRKSRIYAGKKAVAAMMAAVLLICAFPMPAFADNNKINELEDEIKRKKEEREQTKGEINERKDELEDLQETTEGLKGELNNLNANLTEVSNNLEELEKQIEDKNAEIEQTNQELDEARQTEQTQYAAMKKRVQFMYEKQDYVMLEMLFGSASFSDFLNRNNYFEQLSAYDRKQLEAFKATRQEIEQKEAQLEKEKKDPAKNEAFRGNEKVSEKVEVYNKLKEHAAAISKAMRTPWHADDLELREQNTFVYVDFPLPVSILNDSIRNRISEMYKLADMVTLADVNCRLRMTFTVANVWKE